MQELLADILAIMVFFLSAVSATFGCLYFRKSFTRIAWLSGYLVAFFLLLKMDYFLSFTKISLALIYGPFEYGFMEYSMRLKAILSSREVIGLSTGFTAYLSVVFFSLYRLGLFLYVRSFFRERIYAGSLKITYFILTNIWGLIPLVFFTKYLDRKWRYTEVVKEGPIVGLSSRDGLYLVRLNYLWSLLRSGAIFRGRESSINIHQDVSVPRSVFDTGAMFLGAPGSGKSNVLKGVFLQPAISKGERCIVYCYKGEYCESFSGLQSALILSPFDARSVRWWIGRDVNTKDRFLEFMWAFVATDHHITKQRFFEVSFVDVATAVFLRLRSQKGEEWTFLDLYRELHNVADIGSAIDEHHPDAKLLFQGKDDSDQTAGIFGTIREKMIRLDALSRAWTDPGIERFSIRDFLADDYQGDKRILIIRSHPSYSKTTSDFLSVFVESMIGHVKSMPDCVGRHRGNLFLDELQTLSRIPSLLEVPRISRSKGFLIFVGSQDLLKTDKQYQDEGGMAALSNALGMKFLGRFEEDKTKEMASRLCDEVRVEKWSFELEGRGSKVRERYRVNIQDRRALVGGSFSLPKPTLNVPATFYLKYADWPVVKLSYRMVAFEKKYPGLVEASWLSERASDESIRALVGSPSEDEESLGIESPGDKLHRKKPKGRSFKKI